MVGLAIRSESIDHFIIILQQRTLPTSIHPYTLQPPPRSEAARCRLGRRIIAGHGMWQSVPLYRPLHRCPHDLGISLNIYISEFWNMAPHHMLIRVSKCFPICRPPPLSVSPSILTVALPSSPPPPPFSFPLRILLLPDSKWTQDGHELEINYAKGILNLFCFLQFCL